MSVASIRANVKALKRQQPEAVVIFLRGEIEMEGDRRGQYLETNQVQVTVGEEKKSFEVPPGTTRKELATILSDSLDCKWLTVTYINSTT